MLRYGVQHQKVAARLKAERDSKAAAQAPAKPASTQAASKGTTKVAEEKPITQISESEKVKAYRTHMWRKALRREAAANADTANAYLLAMALTGLSRHIAGDVMGKIFEKLVDEKSSATDLKKNLSAVDDLDGGKRQSLSVALTVAAIEGIEVSHLVALCQYHKLDLRLHWNLQKSKDFLEMLTKSEMKVLADELGLRVALGENFAKVFNKSKPELIEALLKVDGFDYTGKVPKVLCF